MTCIVAVADEHAVYLGGDSAGVGSWYELTVRSDQKVFSVGPYVMGFTTSFRMGQLLRYSFKPSIPPEGEDLHEFLCTTFVDEVRECFKGGGFAKKEKEQDEGGSFIVGYKNQIFCIESDYQVGIPADGFYAIGCGAQIALGSLYSTRDMDNPITRGTEALKAAERFSAGVRAPFSWATNLGD